MVYKPVSKWRIVDIALFLVKPKKEHSYALRRQKKLRKCTKQPHGSPHTCAPVNIR